MLVRSGGQIGFWASIAFVCVRHDGRNQRCVDSITTKHSQ